MNLSITGKKFTTTNPLQKISDSVPPPPKPQLQKPTTTNPAQQKKPILPAKPKTIIKKNPSAQTSVKPATK
jgi:hypothetical protein